MNIFANHLDSIRILCWLCLVCLVPPAIAQTIQDDLGNTLATAPAAQRIITLAPHATELVQAIGAEDLLVAVAAFSPGITKSIPRISALGSIDRELILQLEPDLIIAWASGNKPRDLEWSEKQGIRVYRSEPARLGQLAQSMRAIGRLANRTQPAERAANQFAAALAQACTTPKNQEVYVSIWPTPAMTVGGKHWLNDVLQHAGMHNTYAAIQHGIFAVERESLLSKQHLLHLSSQTMGDKNAINHRVIDTLGRPGPAIIQAIQQLCQSSKLDANPGSYRPHSNATESLHHHGLTTFSAQSNR